jgi:hypothetical protein
MWGNRVVDLLIKALKDNDEGVRRYATEVLGRIRKAEYFASIILKACSEFGKVFTYFSMLGAIGCRDLQSRC